MNPEATVPISGPEDRAKPARLVQLASIISVLAVWLLARPYIGIAMDGIIYVGRALADLDPAGIGRQLDYAHDGQAAFSLFSPLLRWLTSAIGAGPSAELAGTAGLVAWIAAAAFLFGRFAKGERLWAVLICMAVLPAYYGFRSAFQVAEPLATPRALAEAACLAAIGLAVRERFIAGLCALIAALLLHPLMALPAVVVILILLSLKEPKWWLMFPAGLLIFVTMAVLGAPVAHRLLESFDPLWRGLIAQRAPLVFISLWPQDSWGKLAFQVSTVLLAGMTEDKELRKLLLTVTLVTLVALVVSLSPSVLVVQLQVWRAQWLLAVLATASVPFAVDVLLRRGPTGYACLGFLALAWLGNDILPLAMGASTVSLLLAGWPSSRPISRPVAVGLCVLAAGVAVSIEAIRITACLALLVTARRYLHESLLASGVAAPPIALFALIMIFWAPRLDGALRGGLALTGAAAILVAAIWVWDDRPPINRWAEAMNGPPPLQSVLHPDAVYWLGSRGVSWLITGTADWWGPYQGAGVVFDRDQAVEWARRRQIAVASGLVALPGRLTAINARSLERICRADDGPRWVIDALPAINDQALASRAIIWRAPVGDSLRSIDGKSWVDLRDYAIFDCVKVRKVE